MLVEEYNEISNISLDEMKIIWRSIKESSIIIDGWASHFLIDKRFSEWKGIHYVGSKDIDFGIRRKNLIKISKILTNIGFTPLNFRFYKIFDRDTGKIINIKESKKKPVFELFYLYVDLLTDEKIENERSVTFFHDPLLKFSMDNNLTQKIDDFTVLRPEPLVLSKLRCIKERTSDKRIKDLLDILCLINLTDLDKHLFSELSDLYKFDKKFVSNTINDADEELSALRMDLDEIRNIKTTFLSFIE